MRQLKRIWRGWLKVTMFLGHVQMVVFLTVIYWLVLSWFALGFKLFNDPLALRRGKPAQWIPRAEPGEPLAGMREQG